MRVIDVYVKQCSRGRQGVWQPPWASFGGLERQQLHAFRHLIAHAVQHGFDDAVGRCRERVLHLHGLHDDQRCALGDGLPRGGQHGDDLAGHRRRQLAAFVVGLAGMGERVVALQRPVRTAGEDVERVAIGMHLAGRLVRAERDGEGLCMAL